MDKRPTCYDQLSCLVGNPSTARRLSRGNTLLATSTSQSGVFQTVSPLRQATKALQRRYHKSPEVAKALQRRHTSVKAVDNRHSATHPHSISSMTTSHSRAFQNQAVQSGTPNPSKVAHPSRLK
ncbi:hypothetical protein JCGZ_07868 [Jatropha curcas]|uniref:Uncharacterized protein n=1 Tax=Jatropha curcas TaxID=180498 RepID=A0A067KWL1_JATCU|nr:hypothetical protein JCGZ_07868 [Jatropha curcas]